MNVIPIVAESSPYGWEALGMTLAAALLPAMGVFIWALFFRKRGVRRIRRRRRVYTGANPASTHTNGATPNLDREKVTGEPRS